MINSTGNVVLPDDAIADMFSLLMTCIVLVYFLNVSDVFDCSTTRLVWTYQNDGYRQIVRTLVQERPHLGTRSNKHTHTHTYTDTADIRSPPVNIADNLYGRHLPAINCRKSIIILI